MSNTGAQCTLMIDERISQVLAIISDSKLQRKMDLSRFRT